MTNLMQSIRAYGRACAAEEAAYAAGFGDREEAAVAEQKRLLSTLQEEIDRITKGKP